MHILSDSFVRFQKSKHYHNSQMKTKYRECNACELDEILRICYNGLAVQFVIKSLVEDVHDVLQRPIH